MNIQNIQPALSAAALQAVRAAERVPAAGEPASARQAAPVYDEYIPEEPSEATGLYRIAHDEDGAPRIEYDDPDGKAETTTTNTDKVDREIKRLKEKREQLEQQLASADPQAAEALERQLAQVESELRQKDNDTYRRQNAVISEITR